MTVALRRVKPVRGKDAEATREAILDAARRAFTRHGFEGVGVREIAAGAGCNASLVNRYFGGKEALFAEVMGKAISLDLLLEGPRGEFGARLADYLMKKEKGAFDAMVAGLRSATSPAALAVVQRELETELEGKLARWLGGRQAKDRAALIVAIMAGVDLMASVVRSPAFDRRRARQIAPLLARVIQTCVDAG